ncbi:hypothetical protein GIB67_022136, partial [Kingdonia uniflora]
MKSDKEVNEQVDEENQTQDGRAKKGTSNAKNYTSRCTGVGLNKIFAALPEEKKGALCTTCFAPLLLIDPIMMMSTLAVEIFNRHLGDMKFQFRGTIIQIKPIHVCLILGLRVSPIINELLFVDLEHMTNFRMRRFPKKKNTYGLKEIDSALKRQNWKDIMVRRYSSIKFVKNYIIISPPEHGEKRWGERNHIEAPSIGAAIVIEPPAVSVPAVRVPVIGSRSSAIKIRVVVVVRIEEKKKGKGEKQKKTNANKKNKNVKEADVPLKKKVEGMKIEDLTDEQLDHVPLIQLKTLIPKIAKGLANRAPRKRRAEFPELENIQSTAKKLLQQVAPGKGLEVWKKGEKDGKEKAEDDKEQLKVADEEKVQDIDDLEQETVMVYYDRKKDVVEEANETMIVKIDIVFFDQEEVVSEAYQTMEVAKTEDEASQTKESKEEVEQSKEEVVEDKDDDDINSQITTTNT